MVYKWLKPVTNPSNTKLMTHITFFGSRYFFFPVYVLVVAFYLFFKKDVRLAFDIAIVGIVGNQIWSLLQNDIFHRTRPIDPLIPNVTGYGFPSGHSFSSYTFCGLITYLIWQTKLQTIWKVIFSVVLFLIATIIAISRVYLHVHYATDVIGGFCLSVMWLILSLWLLSKISIKFIQRKNH